MRLKSVGRHVFAKSWTGLVARRGGAGSSFHHRCCECTDYEYLVRTNTSNINFKISTKGTIVHVTSKA